MINEPITGKRSDSKVSYNTLESTMAATGKLTPQALEFEEAVLGALMIDSNAVSSIIDLIDYQMFYKESHQHIYKAIFELFSEMPPID